MSTIARAEKSGEYCIIRAMIPATCGAAILVPASTLWNLSGSLCAGVIRDDLAEAMNIPGATMSGLVRLSRVGPSELNGAICPI